MHELFSDAGEQHANEGYLCQLGAFVHGWMDDKRYRNLSNDANFHHISTAILR